MKQPVFSILNALFEKEAELKRVALSVLSIALSVAIALGIWYALLRISTLDPYFAKAPHDIWHYLFASTNAEQNRSAMLAPFMTTLRDAGIGFTVGLMAGIFCATTFLIWTPLRRTLLPIFLATQSVPMVAMIPLIVLIFGRGLAGITVVTGLVTFFPTLVNLTTAMQSQETAFLDFFRVFNASKRAIVSKLLLPSATPALLACMRIAVPRALLGALLVEWLATGDGIGYFMVLSSVTADYNRLWSAVVILAAISYAVYTAVSAIEQYLLTYYGWRQRHEHN